MVSFLVASWVLANARPDQTAQRKAISASVQETIWTKVAPSCPVILDQYGRKTGLAVLIDRSGILLTHRFNLTQGAIQAQFPLSQAYDLTVIASDPATQLVALQIVGWHGGSNPVTVLPAEIPLGEVVLAATRQGALRGQLVSRNRPGMMAPSNRYLPLMEVLLEKSEFNLGGALVFSQNGELAGILGATLARPHQAGSAKVTTVRNGLQAYGPQGVTVGYALGPSLLRRVVEGFRSPQHLVKYPAIGVQYSDSDQNNGALIQSVTEGSPADRAGIKAGDIVNGIDDKEVTNAVEFGATLLEKSIGSSVTLTLLRKTEQISVTVRIEAQAPASR